MRETLRIEPDEIGRQKGAGMTLEGTCLALSVPLRRYPSRGTATLLLFRSQR